MHGGHANNESKQIVDESIQRSKHEKFPREVCYALQFVIDEELRGHNYKTKRIHHVHGACNEPPIITVMPNTKCGMNHRTDHDRIKDISKVAGGLPVGKEGQS